MTFGYSLRAAMQLGNRIITWWSDVIVRTPRAGSLMGNHPMHNVRTQRLVRLPGETLEHIFMFAGPQATARSSSVSQDWYAAASQPVLWKRFLAVSEYKNGCVVLPKEPPEGLSWQQWYGLHDDARRRLPSCIAASKTKGEAFAAPSAVTETYRLAQAALCVGACAPASLLIGAVSTVVYLSASVVLAAFGMLAALVGILRIVVHSVRTLCAVSSGAKPQRMPEALSDGATALVDSMTYLLMAQLSALIGLWAAPVGVATSVVCAMVSGIATGGSVWQTLRHPRGTVRWLVTRPASLRHQRALCRLEMLHAERSLRLDRMRRHWSADE